MNTLINTFKVGLLLTVLTVLFVGLGHLIGGSTGAAIAFSLALLMNVGSYWFSDKMVLAMYGATPLSAAAAPQLYQMVEYLSARAGIPMPRLYVVPESQPNAFATGRSPSHAAVAVTEGLLHLLNSDEIEGVLAHEIAHIKHRDTLTMTVVATIAGAIMMLADFGRIAAMFGGQHDENEQGANPLTVLLATLIAPFAAFLVQMAISRAREYEADATAARLVGSPYGLVQALRKLERGAAMMPMNAAPATSHLFIVNPLSGLGGVLMNLFMTHPPIEKRIENLLHRVGHGRLAYS